MTRHENQTPNTPRQVLAELPFQAVPLERGYAGRYLRVDLTRRALSIHPVTRQMKDLWVGGKGFDLWLTLQELPGPIAWDDPANPICFSSGPLGGITSFPGSGKTIVTAISPQTGSVMDCNVGGYFGPFLKFAGFDALVVTGRAEAETIVLIDAPAGRATLEPSPTAERDSHLLAEELTARFGRDETDRRNISVVATGRAADHVRMGMLNFSFYDWRRRTTRLKQAGRGGLGTVFRNKRLVAIVVRSQGVPAGWRVEPSKAAGLLPPIAAGPVVGGEAAAAAAAELHGRDPERCGEMLREVQARLGWIPQAAIEEIGRQARTTRGRLFRIATSDPTLRLAPPGSPPAPAGPGAGEPPRGLREPDRAGPGSLERNAAQGGGENLRQALRLGPEKLLARLAAALPGGSRWEAVAAQAAAKGTKPLLVVNGAGSGPAAPIARTLLAGAPWAVLEGALLAALAIGAEEAALAVAGDEADLARDLAAFLGRARELGLLGEAILGPSRRLDLQLRRVPAGLQVGEETALAEALGGGSGEPRGDGWTLAESGWRGRPTLVASVETLAGLGPLLAGPGSLTTRLLVLAGALRNPGLVEVPLGMPLREILGKFGGGPPEGQRWKAVQVGAPAGGLVPAAALDVPFDPGALAALGAPLGAGVLLALAEDECLVDRLRRDLAWLAGESCGKCTPCREGLPILARTVDRIAAGGGQEEDPALLEEVAATVREASLCGFGAQAPLGLEGALRHFRGEIEAHIRSGGCPAGRCGGGASREERP